LANNTWPQRGGTIEPWQHPAGGALEDLDEFGLLDEFGDDLDGTRAGAITATRLPVKS